MKRYLPVARSKNCSTAPPQHRLRILVVEDHADTRRGLEGLLGLLGHQASFAPDVQTALQLAANRSFDLLLSDIGLPDGTGWELLRRLAELNCRPPQAVAISGFDSCTDLQKSQLAGFRTHLVKPFAPEELETVLEAVAADLSTASTAILPA